LWLKSARNDIPMAAKDALSAILHQRKDPSSIKERVCMSSEINTFATATQEKLIPLFKEMKQAWWEAATTGTPKAIERQKKAQADLMRFWANRERFDTAKRLHESGEAPDALQARLIKRLYLSAAKAQQDEETIERVTELEAEVREHYYNFRPELDGSRLSDNELDDILRDSVDSNEVRSAWLASKQVGALVAEQIRELARLRNAAARAQGYRDHFERMLTLNEIDEGELLRIFGDLEKATDEPFDHMKAEMDALRAKRFGIGIEALRPWHYPNRFFQSAPNLTELDTRVLYEDKDPVQLALATYDGLGMDLRGVVERSDLYPREGKNQHAFCLDMDREGDVRTLNNLQPNERWTGTLLHELGHAAYDIYIDPELPWLLRAPSHSLTTEAIAILMGARTRDVDWLRQILGLSEKDAKRYAEAGRIQQRAARLAFTRWALVMTHFERELYANPERDLDSYWWELVERYQKLMRPERMAPDWAAKIHIALEPVYYQNYELGEVVVAQVERCLEREVGGIVGKVEAGEWLKERFFRPGARQDWSAHIESATGEPLNVDYFVDAVS
jgi:peptidyl-dipeptidase A